MKGIIAWFAGNSVAANLLMFGVVVLGLGVLPSLRQEVVPTIVVDSVVIQMPYPGAAPEEIEKSICMRIEENVQGLSGVDEVTSTASESMGTVTVKLLFGTNRNVMLADVKSAVDRIDSFPDGAEEPTVSLVDLNDSAMKVVVWGDADARTLREVSADIQSGLTGLDNISLVKLVNAPAYEMSIEVREQDLRRYGMTFDEVSNAIRQSSLDIPTGSIKTSGGEILLRGKGQSYSGTDFAAITLRHLPNGTELSLGDVADIRDGFSDTDQALRFNGKPAAMIDIFRVGDQDALAIGPEAQKFLDEYQTQLPAELVLSITGDETAMLKDRLSLMLENGAQGLALVLITLALFLRLRLALWVTVGIPVSFLGGIWLMPYMDVSVNMISLFAFIIVLGIVVDDAIVVAENIHHNRQTERGKKDGLWAATTGTSEMSKPVIFAILTTMVAFTPMLFMPGTMGQFSRNIPLIVIAVLIFSMVESLLVLPAHLRHLPADESLENPGLLGMLQNGVDKGLNWFITRVYKPSLELGLTFRYATLAAGIAMFVVTLVLPTAGWLKFNFFPQIEADNVAVGLTMPLGTPLAVTEGAILEFEDVAKELGRELEEREGRPIVVSILTALGGQPYREKQSRAGGSAGSTYSGAHLAEINVELVSAEYREIASQEFADLWEERAGRVPGAEALTFSADMMGGDGDIDVQLRGDDMDELRGLADELKLKLSAMNGVVSVRDNFAAGKRELEIGITPEGEAAGLTYLELVRQVRQAFYGEEVQTIQRGRDEVKVFVRYTETERRTLAALENMRIRLQDGTELPFGQVATVTPGIGFSTINRANRGRTIDVVADLDTKLLTPSALEATLTDVTLPALLADHPNVATSFEGPGKEQKQFMGEMMRNGITALVAMFILLAVPLRSYTRPFAIMLAIPFGLIGAFWGHMITGFDLSMFSIIGVMALTGIVVNDSLVLIDYTDKQRKEKGLNAHDAVVAGGTRRFRAIMLTTMTTFAGLTPLLLEKSMQARFMLPMAVSLAFGVVFATFITLVLIPAFYLIIEDFHDLPGKLKGIPGKVKGIWASGSAPVEEA